MRSRAEAPRHPGRFSMRSLEHALDGLPLYGGNAFVHFRLPITQVLRIRGEVLGPSILIGLYWPA